MSIILFVCGAAPVRVAAASSSQAPPAQPAGELLLPVLTPTTQTEMALHTHIATIRLLPNNGGVDAVLDARYVLRNDNKEPAGAQVQLPASQGAGAALTVDGEPLALQQGDNDMVVAQITVPADGSVDLDLTFTARLDGALLAQVRYPAELLNQWPGQRSLRVDIQPDISMPPESWLRVEPGSWSYAPPAVSPDLAIEWLSEGDAPGQILFQVVVPAAWSQLAQARPVAGAVDPIERFVALGELNAQLAAAAAATGNQLAHERFYGEAVAAYADGIRQIDSGGAPSPASAALHSGLAALYRSRVVQPDGSSSATYAEQMAMEAGRALASLPADDPRRLELERWQAEGLRLLVTDARRRGDVTGALALIDRLAAASAGAASAEFLANERQVLVVEQALQLLAQGDRTAAFALAGNALSDPALQPPLETQSLFATWNIAAAISTAGIDLIADVRPFPERHDEAAALLKEMVQNWKATPELRRYKVNLAELPTEDDGVAPGYRLAIHLPAGAAGVDLAETLPQRADWALLRLLLAQLGPEVESHTEGVRQQVHMAQPIDLRTAGDQWEAAAVSLEQQAAQLENQAASTSGGETATADASIRARIQAANLRHAAQNWRDLARDSYVRVSLTTPGGLVNAARTWQITVDSAPQMLDVAVESLSTGRVALAIAIALFLIVVLAGLLWWLL